MDTFIRTLQWAKHYQDMGTQGEISLTGIGESFMHPNIVDMIAMTREALPFNEIVIATNGILLNNEICEKISKYKPKIYVSLHRPEMAGPAINAARKAGLWVDVNASFVTDSLNWAGKVDWYVSAKNILCDFLLRGWAVVMMDGRITTCCLDSTGEGMIGNINDEIGMAQMIPYSLCSECHMQVP